MIQPLATIVNISKNKKDEDIFVDTKIGMEVKTTNPNPFTSDVVTIVKIDSTKLELDKTSPKEGVMADLRGLTFVPTYSLPVYAQNNSSSNTTIEIISSDTIKITYLNLQPNESKYVTFIVTSLVVGKTDVQGTSKLTAFDVQSNANLPVQAQPTLLRFLPRTGGVQGGLSILTALSILAGALFIASNRKKNIDTNKL